MLVENRWGDPGFQLLGCSSRHKYLRRLLISLSSAHGCRSHRRGDVIAITAVLPHQPAACWAAAEGQPCGRMLFLLGAPRSDSELPAGSMGRKASAGLLADVLMLSEGWWRDYHNFADSAIPRLSCLYAREDNSFIHRSLKESSVCFLQVRVGG